VLLYTVSRALKKINAIKGQDEKSNAVYALAPAEVAFFGKTVREITIYMNQIGIFEA